MLTWGKLLGLILLVWQQQVLADILVLPPDNLPYSVPSKKIVNPYTITVSPEIPEEVRQTLSFHSESRGFLKLVSSSEETDCKVPLKINRKIRLRLDDRIGGINVFDNPSRFNIIVPNSNYEVDLEYGFSQPDASCTFVRIKFELEFYEYNSAPDFEFRGAATMTSAVQNGNVVFDIDYDSSGLNYNVGDKSFLPTTQTIGTVYFRDSNLECDIGELKGNLNTNSKGTLHLEVLNSACIGFQFNSRFTPMRLKIKRVVYQAGVVIYQSENLSLDLVPQQNIY